MWGQERLVESSKIPHIEVYVKKTEIEYNDLFVFNIFYVYYLF